MNHIWGRRSEGKGDLLWKACSLLENIVLHRKRWSIQRKLVSWAADENSSMKVKANKSSCRSLLTAVMSRYCHWNNELWANVHMNRLFSSSEGEGQPKPAVQFENVCMLPKHASWDWNFRKTMKKMLANDFLRDMPGAPSKPEKGQIYSKSWSNLDCMRNGNKKT